MTARAIAIPTDRVSVRCTKCNTVASLLTMNLSTWRADHDQRCIPRPMGVEAAEQLREERAGADANETSVSAGRAANAAPLHPVCGLVYNGDRCHLPLGHKEECTDENGNLLEIAF